MSYVIGTTTKKFFTHRVSNKVLEVSVVPDVSITDLTISVQKCNMYYLKQKKKEEIGEGEHVNIQSFVVVKKI